MGPSKDANVEEYQMETEDEKSPETNAEADENLTEDAVEIDLEDDGLTELLGLEEEEVEEEEEDEDEDEDFFPFEEEAEGEEEACLAFSL